MDHQPRPLADVKRCRLRKVYLRVMCCKCKIVSCILLGRNYLSFMNALCFRSEFLWLFLKFIYSSFDFIKYVLWHQFLEKHWWNNQYRGDYHKSDEVIDLSSHFYFFFWYFVRFWCVFLHAKFQDHSFCELNFTEGILRLSPVSLDFQNIWCEKR